MKLYVTSLIDNEQRNKSGHLYKVDHETGNIEKKKMMEPTLAYTERRVAPDPCRENQVGGPPGLRGISIYNDKVYCANSDSIFCYDRNLNLLKDKTIQNKSTDLNSLHDIFVENEDSIWVLSTGNNRVVKINNRGDIKEEIDFTSDDMLEKLKEMHFLLKYRINRIMKENLNSESSKEIVFRMNTLAKNKEKLYVFLQKLELLLQIKPEIKIIWFVNNTNNLIERKLPFINSKVNMQGGMDCEFIDSHTIIMNNTPEKKLEFYNIQKQKHMYSLAPFELGANLEKEGNGNQYKHQNYLRGLKYLENSNTLLIGSSPAKIIELDLKNNQVIREIELEKTPGHLIYDIEAAQEN